jgi:hypothetical protein
MRAKQCIDSLAYMLALIVLMFILCVLAVSAHCDNKSYRSGACSQLLHRVQLQPVHVQPAAAMEVFCGSSTRLAAVP